MKISGIISSFGLAIFGVLLLAGSNFLASYVLTVENYQNYSKIHFISMYASAILQLSVASTAPIIIKIKDGLLDGVEGIYSLQLMVIIIGYTIFAIVLLTVNDGERRKDCLQIISMSLLFSSVLNMQGILQIAEEKAYSLIFAATSSIIFLIQVYLYCVGEIDQYKFVALVILTNFISIIIFKLILKKLTHHENKFSIKSILVLLRNYGKSVLFPASLSGIFIGLYFIGIFNLVDENTNSMALVGFAFTIKQGLMFFSNSVNRYSYILLSKQIHSKGHINVVGKIEKYGMLLSGGSLVLGIIFIFVLSEFFHSKYLGKFISGDWYFVVLIFLWATADIFYQSRYQLLQAMGKFKHSMYFIVIPIFFCVVFMNVCEIKYSHITTLYFLISAVLYSILVTEKLRKIS